MTDLIIPRRKFLTGLFGLVAAPAVVKASNIMPVKVMPSESQLIKRWLHDSDEVAYGYYMGTLNPVLVESFRITKEEHCKRMIDEILERANI